MSGNTCGARFWTDGKMEAPMLPDEPWLVKCWHCGTLVWIGELEQVEEVTPWGDGSPSGAGAQPYDTASFADYIAVLGKGGLDNRKEKYLRVRAWWAGNDKRRKKTQGKPLSAEESANILAYITLLDDSDEEDRITKAEALRELGRHEDALIILLMPLNERLDQIAESIKALAEQKASVVKEIKAK